MDCALQLGAEEPADQDAVDRARRVGDRHVHHDDPLARLAEHLPQGLGRHTPGIGDGGLVGTGLAVDKAIDAVPRRVDAGHIAAPGHRGHGRVDRVHTHETRLLCDVGEIGHVAFPQHALKKGVRRSVQSDDH